nr:reverse transcriptase domain-containing protein [Tanacetum cinerariifolium]
MTPYTAYPDIQGIIYEDEMNKNRLMRTEELHNQNRRDLPRDNPLDSVEVLRPRRALIDVYGEELTLSVDDEAITFKVGQTSKYSYNDAESINRIDVIDVACEEYVQEVLGFSDKSKSDNPTPILDPIIALSSPSLTPFEGGDFILEEINACLTSESILPGIDDTDLDLEGDIHLLEELLNNDPSSSLLPLKELNSISSSKGATRSQPKSSAKSAHAEEHGQKVNDLEDESHQEFNTGNDDETSIREALDVDESQWNPSSFPTPNHEWHKTITVDNRPPQPWIT